MLKRIHWFVLLLVLIFSASTAQAFNCQGSRYQGYSLYNPSIRDSTIIDKILQAARIYDADDYKICTIKHGFDNASINTSQRYIIFDESYLHSQARLSGEEYWGAVAILAHEIGHHVFSDSGNRGFSNLESNIYRELASLARSRIGELNADSFAGYALAYLGASLENSQALMKTMEERYDILSTHPSGPKRVRAVTIGWLQACKELGRECNNPHLKNKNKAPTYSTDLYHGQVAETRSYSQFIGWANRLKGKLIPANYCQLYANVAVSQAKRNIANYCGYSVDSSDPASQWSVEWTPQYNWCMKMSAFATEKETKYREKKLIDCIR